MSLEKIKEAFNKLSPEEWEEINKEFEKEHPPIPKGWLSIEDYKPMMYAKDIMKGYSEFKVRDINGNESIAHISDGNIWYYLAKEQGITEWYNE